MATKPTHIAAINIAMAYVLLAALAVAATPLGSGFCYIWPSSAVLVAYIAPRNRRVWGLTIGLSVGALGVLLAAHGLKWVTCLWMVIADTVEALIAAGLMRRLLRPHGHTGPRSDEIGWLMRLVFLVSLIPPIVSGLILWGALKQFSPESWHLARDWMLGHALGLMMFLPCLTRIQRLWRQYRQNGRARTSAWSLRKTLSLGFPVLMTATAVLSFGLSDRPLLFLPVLVLVAAMLWIDLIVLSCMYLLLASAAAMVAMLGHGPLTLLHVPLAVQLTSVQVYLLLTMACITPVSGLVNQLRRSLGELRESEARYRLLADHSTDVIMSTGLNGCIRFISPSLLALTQHQPSDVMGHRALLLVCAQHRRAVMKAHARAIAAPGETVLVEFESQPLIGAPRWFEAHMRAVADRRGLAECVVTVIRDMSERKRVESALAEAAFTDPLTGLPNRRALMEAMEGCIAQNRPAALAVIDLDHFKQVNDRYGHAAGDEVLRSFARVARQGLRASDMLARIGGEEFALLLPGADIALAELICRRIGATLAHTVTRHGEMAISVTSSMGLAVLGDNAMVAFDQADKALYIAKARGRARLQVAA
ncbi:sensor domain-containing diguanylate cyclase [Novosphingobium rosa]|uniref:sensor domain-containing diguanylate cyclase n=1 Tax=Novosphingobium rosa TaxID=76978 RepID=UPI0008374F3A|nr:sensor domain-containing diguanylate cyclase [Novosphingobium rosa]